MATKVAPTSKPPAKNNKPAKNKKPGSGLPLLKYGGDLTYDKVSGQQIETDPMDLTDTTFDYGEVTPDTITAGKVSTDKITAGSVTAKNLANQFMTAADYTVVDAGKIASEFGDINREQMRKNSDLSSELALDALDTELQGLKNYAPAAATLKRSQIALDNDFNQDQRNRQLEQGDPNLRSDLEGQAVRARRFAEGGVPDSINDKALELGIRSRAADAASAGGFGVNSSAARKAASLMSAEQRIGLSQYGDQLLTNNIGARSELLLSPTQYSDAGAQIKVTPTQSAGQIALGIASEANAGNITAKDAYAGEVQQQQFKTNLEQDTRKTNVTLAAERDLNQAKLDLQADTSNVDRALQADTVSAANKLQADTFNASSDLQAQTTNAANKLQAQTINASNAIDTQKTAMTIKSSESQFNAQLNFNTKNSNADRQFQADNVNAGRALDVATANRNMQFEIQKTNKQMIYQDRVRKEQEAAANARAAAANAASIARARISAASQAQALAANAQAQAEARAFAEKQQAAALEAYKKGQDKAQSAQNFAAAGQLIMRIPSIIDGASKTIDSFGKIYDSIYGSNTDYSGGGDTIGGITTSKYDFSTPDFGTSSTSTSGYSQYDTSNYDTLNI